MESVIAKVEAAYKKKAVVDIRPGDTVKVHQKIREGGKERIQIFEGMVIRASRKNSLTSTFTVRRIASSVGVEKTYLIHSPSILRVQVTKRSKVRRNYLTYMRQRTGKSTRLSGVEFDSEAVNAAAEAAAADEEAKIHEAQAEAHEEAETKKAEKDAKQEAKVEEALAARDDTDKHSEKSEQKPAEPKRPADKN